jgi:rRNA pseudouridine-1189 N-methylase Emg1 (Nep1/Mra1 family)
VLRTSLGFSQQGTLYSPAALADALPDDVPVVLVFGAFAVGMIQSSDHPYVRIYLCATQFDDSKHLQMQELVSISEYPLSGSVAINRVLGAVEARWGIV